MRKFILVYLKQLSKKSFRSKVSKNETEFPKHTLPLKDSIIKWRILKDIDKDIDEKIYFGLFEAAFKEIFPK